MIVTPIRYNYHLLVPVKMTAYVPVIIIGRWLDSNVITNPDQGGTLHASGDYLYVLLLKTM